MKNDYSKLFLYYIEMSELSELLQSLSQYPPQKTIDDIYQLISAPIQHYSPFRSKAEVIKQIDSMLSELRSKPSRKSNSHKSNS